MTKRFATIACYHHRGADPNEMCAVQVVLHDEKRQVYDFQAWMLDGHTNQNEEELVQQVWLYIHNLGKIDSVFMINRSLEYENELCPCCGELTQRVHQGKRH